MSNNITIRVQPEQVTGQISPYLTGACIEDVNHEIYGGIYSQLIFGESFEEAPMLIDARLEPAFAGLSGSVSCLTGRSYLRERSAVCSWQPFRRGTAEGAFEVSILRARAAATARKSLSLSGKARWASRTRA